MIIRTTNVTDRWYNVLFIRLDRPFGSIIRLESHLAGEPQVFQRN